MLKAAACVAQPPLAVCIGRRRAALKQKLVELKVEGIAVDRSSAPVVVLRDKEGDRLVNIWIGPAEAEAIARELEQRHLPRPMTHDLIRNIFSELNVIVESLVISDVRDDTYFACLTLVFNADRKEVDCRPSDGIAIALRTSSPIFIHEDLLARIEEERKAREHAFVVDSGGTIH